MSTESLVRELLTAGDSGDVAAFKDILHEDVVVHAPFGLSTVGIEEEQQSWRQAKSAMPDIRHEIQDIVAREDLVAAQTVVTGTLKGSYGGLTARGRSFRVEQAIFARVREGKIAELWEIVDTASLRRQLEGENGPRAE